MIKQTEYTMEYERLRKLWSDRQPGRVRHDNYQSSCGIGFRAKYHGISCVDLTPVTIYAPMGYGLSVYMHGRCYRVPGTDKLIFRDSKAIKYYLDHH